MLLSTAFFHKMDTSSGLSSIASLSVGFTMSMRAGGMAAFAANRGGGWSTGVTGAWPVKPVNNQTTHDTSHSDDNLTDDKSSHSQSVSVTDSCRSLVVPSVSLVAAPLTSNDRQNSQLELPQSATSRPMSCIVEVTEDADSFSTDDEQPLTVTSTSSAPIVNVCTAVELQTTNEGSTMRHPSLSSPHDVVATNETVVKTLSEAARRHSDQTEDIVDKLEAKRPSIGHISDNDSLPLPFTSGQQVRDDVIVAMDDNDVNCDVVSFFTPSIVDSLTQVVSPITQLVPQRDSPPCKHVSDISDDTATTAAPLLKNGADSSAVRWPPTNRLGLAASPRAESSASSAWWKNPLERLVRHGKDTVCQIVNDDDSLIDSFHLSLACLQLLQ